MSIPNPSQYECDSSQKGDLIVIRNRPKLYKWYRKNFQKDKIILKIRKNWTSDETIEAYQEDCTLIFSWEVQGKSEFENEIPYYLGYNNKFVPFGSKLKKMQFGSENVSIVLHGGLSILIPTSYIRSGLDKLEAARRGVDEDRQIQQALKFARYKGDFFKKRQEELGVEEWTISYCIVCGNPVKIRFDKEEPYIDNTCKCGNMVVASEPITWNTVAFWFNSRTQQPVINSYKEFWKI